MKIQKAFATGLAAVFLSSNLYSQVLTPKGEKFSRAKPAAQSKAKVKTITLPSKITAPAAKKPAEQKPAEQKFRQRNYKIGAAYEGGLNSLEVSARVYKKAWLKYGQGRKDYHSEDTEISRIGTRFTGEALTIDDKVDSTRYIGVNLEYSANKSKTMYAVAGLDYYVTSTRSNRDVQEKIKDQAGNILSSDHETYTGWNNSNGIKALVGAIYKPAKSEKHGKSNFYAGAALMIDKNPQIKINGGVEF